MLAKELKEQYLTEYGLEMCGVIAIGEDFWYHIHDNEEIPDGLTIAFHPRGWRDASEEVENGKS